MPCRELRGSRSSIQGPGMVRWQFPGDKNKPSMYRRSRFWGTVTTTSRAAKKSLRCLSDAGLARYEKKHFARGGEGRDVGEGRGTSEDQTRRVRSENLCLFDCAGWGVVSIRAGPDRLVTFSSVEDRFSKKSSEVLTQPQQAAAVSCCCFGPVVSLKV